MFHRGCAFLFALVLTLSLSAQHVGAGCSISVELRLSPADSNAQLRGELTSAAASAPPLQAWMANGRIEFGEVPAGFYQLNIVNSLGTVLKTLSVQATPDHSPIAIDLTSPSKQRPAAGGVSVHELLHKTSARAVRLFQQAQQSGATGQHPAAVTLLREALAEDPDYFEAHVSLGAELIQARDVAASALEFEKAVRERPDSAIASNDLAAAYIAIHRPLDAERAARRAVAIDSTLPEAHFLLAESLISETFQSPDEAKRGGQISEAANHLRLVGDRIPQAKTLLDWALRRH